MTPGDGDDDRGGGGSSSGGGSSGGGSSGGGGEVVPGEVLAAAGHLTLNPGRESSTLQVVNTGDRPVQVGSHFHFAQANAALAFDRAAAHGRRLDIAAGTAVRFEPGIEREVDLVPLSGTREVWGLQTDAPGHLDDACPAAVTPEEGI